MTHYLKKKGLIDGDLPMEHKHVQANTEVSQGKFATSVGLLDIRKNGKNELVTKISKFPVKLMPCEDGFLQCYPNHLLLQLPPLKRTVKGLRLKLLRYSGNEVLILEQIVKNYRNKGIIGCRYLENAIPKSFEAACGSYEITNDNFKNLSCKCSLSKENGALKLSIETLNVKIISYLKVMGENLAFTQGFGRNARQAVQIHKTKNDIFLIYSGIIFKKSEG